VSAFLRRGRHQIRRLGFLPAPLRATGPPLLRDSVTSDGGTAKRGHGWAELEERVEMKDEVEYALTPERSQYLKRSDREHPTLR
jgi:hypothetical protein